VTKHLLKAQTADGSWVAGGQSGTPNELPTAWAILALASRDEFMNARFPKRETSAPIRRLVEPNDRAIPAAREKAVTWLRKQDPKPTDHLTEAVVTRLLVERKLGTPRDVEERVKALLARQNEDGGWSADVALRQPSDAFATGQALYALNLAGKGDEKEKEAIERATEFLVKTQQKNGSWTVLTKAFSPSEGNATREKKTDEVYTYWGRPGPPSACSTRFPCRTRRRRASRIRAGQRRTRRGTCCGGRTASLRSTPHQPSHCERR
jgi:hypothetical protein